MLCVKIYCACVITNSTKFAQCGIFRLMVKYTLVQLVNKKEVWQGGKESRGQRIVIRDVQLTLVVPTRNTLHPCECVV